jgi:hypothetical protein
LITGAITCAAAGNPVTPSPGWAQRRLGLAVVLALLVAYFIALDLQLGHVDAFIPAYGKAMFVTESITAVLQFVQFFMLPSRR